MDATRTGALAPTLNAPEQRDYGRYELLYHLATGGMAHIYVAQLRGVRGFQKLVAIKRIHDDFVESEHLIQMFIDEAMLAAKIVHPNVVQVIELGHFGDEYFMAMEYVHGESLRLLQRRARVPHRAAAYIVSRAAAGLHAAHELRDDDGRPLEVVHRDVSPHNILVGYDATVKVTDFGIARARDQAHVTQVGAIKGKYPYMSPEQAQGKALDRRSDIFSLGIVLYELTTRQRLFLGSTPVETLQNVREKPVPAPSSVVPHYPPELERVVLKALERDPAKRQQTAEEVQTEIEAYLNFAGTTTTTAHSDLSQLMRQTFAENITRRDDALRAARSAAHVITSTGDTQQTSPTPPPAQDGTAATCDATPRYEDRKTVLGPSGTGPQLPRPGATQGEIVTRSVAMSERFDNATYAGGSVIATFSGPSPATPAPPRRAQRTATITMAIAVVLLAVGFVSWRIAKNETKPAAAPSAAVVEPATARPHEPAAAGVDVATDSTTHLSAGRADVAPRAIDPETLPDGGPADASNPVAEGRSGRSASGRASRRRRSAKPKDVAEDTAITRPTETPRAPAQPKPQLDLVDDGNPALPVVD